MDADKLRVRLGLINAPSLELLRQRMTQAETTLEATRAAMRTAADAGGIKRGGLFEGSKFVLRTAGERWAVEAEKRGHLLGAEWMADKLERAHRPESEKMKDPFYRLAQGMLRRGVAGRDIGDTGLSEVGAIQARILKDREPDLSGNAAIGAATTSEALAEQILAAGKRARSPTDSDPEPEMNALSRAIVESGRKRRQEDK
jgi:hypothetical protein